MLNKENIIELIMQGEGYYLEFKDTLYIAGTQHKLLYLKKFSF
jgi:hypothetical protein